jgi:hypothetical protein
MIICDHCGHDVALRNPSGVCDHLYYPEYCATCRGTSRDEIPKRLHAIYGARVQEAEWYRTYFGELSWDWNRLDDVAKQAWREVAAALERVPSATALAKQTVRDCPHRDEWICCWTCALEAIAHAQGLRC